MSQPPPPPPVPLRGAASGRMRRGPLLAVFGGVLVVVLGVTAVVVFALQAPDPEPACPPERAPCGAPPTEPGLPTPSPTVGVSPTPTATSAPTSSPTPSGTPEPTTSPTPGGSPEPSSSPTPGGSPKPTVSPTPTEAPPVPELRGGEVYRSDLGFEVEFNAGLWRAVHRDARSLELVIGLRGFDVFLTLQGVPAGQATPRQLLDRRLGELRDDVLGLAEDTDPDLTLLGSAVGYRSGVGGRFAGNVDTPQGPGDPLTVVVMAATDHRATVVMSLVSSEASAPTQAVFQVADQVMNTFRFPSEVHS